MSIQLVLYRTISKTKNAPVAIWPLFFRGRAAQAALRLLVFVGLFVLHCNNRVNFQNNNLGEGPGGSSSSPTMGPALPVNLVSDPGFENGTSGFAADQAADSVVVTASALSGAQSIQASIHGYGDSVWWVHELRGKATAFSASARIRSDVASSSTIKFCAFVVYDDGENQFDCARITGAVGAKGIAQSAILLQDKILQSVRIRIEQEGSAPIAVTLDDATAFLTNFVPSTSPGGGGGGGGGGPGNGGDPNDVPPPAGTPYPGYSYTAPPARPYIKMNDFHTDNNTSTAFFRLKDQVDSASAITAALPPGATYAQLVRALQGQHYGYSCTDSIVMYRLTNNPTYLAQAIRMVDLFVQSENLQINAGLRPVVAGDSYLEVGWYLEQLALTYDYGYDTLTPAQRTAWETYANQTIQNVWYPYTATWGGVAYPWSGWSMNDPGNNYYYSFLKATQLWAWASQNTGWIAFLQQRKYTQVVPFFSVLTGGGSREGTGYGTAMGSMFENYRYWRSSTGEDLSAISSHSRDTIDYWLHATVPTLDYYAAIGDQARSADPRMFDYQRRLMLEAVALNPATPQAARGVWWLNRARLSDGGSGSVIGRMRYNYDFRFDLLAPLIAEQAPAALLYDATGAGALFARSDWTTSASWIATVTGTFDQSHAHQEQGTFSFYRGTWLAVTSNIHSRNGLRQEVTAHNVVRFQNGANVIPQNYSTSTKTISDSGNTLLIQENLAPAYADRVQEVQAWDRTLVYDRTQHSLDIHDLCTTAPGVSATWQIHTPVLPVVQPDGTVLAGALRITPVIPAAPVFTIRDMHAESPALYNRGYRLDISAGAQCEFNIHLRAQ